MNNAQRDNLQNQAFETVFRSGRLLLEWGTGVGKSRVGVKLAERLFNDNHRKILLLVAESPHKENWKKEFMEYMPDGWEQVWSCITVECYASLKKYSGTRWDAIIADEAHHLRSEKRQQTLRTMSAGWFLALSATISDKGDGEQLLHTLENTFGHFENLVFGLEDAIEEGFLPEPIIDVRAVQMSEKTQQKYDSLNAHIEKCKKEYYDARDEAGLHHGEEDTSYTADLKNSWMYAANRRKQYMGVLKTWEAGKLLDALRRDGKRVICFCASIRQIEKLGGRNIINSKRTRKQNEATIAAFNNHEIDSLYVVGMLQEGQNLRDIDAGIIVQLDGKERSFIQRFGRVMRSSHPYLYIIYLPDTRDEEYLANALEDRNPEFIHGWAPKKDTPADDDSANLFADYMIPVSAGGIPQRRVITEKNISTSVLQGPWLNRLDIEKMFRTVHFIPGEGVFRLDMAGAPMGVRPKAEGCFYGLSVNPLQDKVSVYLFNKGYLCEVIMEWNSATGVLMQLANKSRVYHQSFTVSARSDGQYTKLRLTEPDGRESLWIDNPVPAYGTRDNSPRLNFVNCLIEDIHSRFMQEKEAGHVR